MFPSFGRDFVFGAAAAAYQIEGAWNADGKGQSIWDAFAHTRGKIKTGENADTACDHYNRYRQDVAIMKELGLNAYRGSIAWTRILPDGAGTANQPGLDFYSRLTDALLEAGITPWYTLFHWDLPLALQKRLGGFRNRDIAEIFADYAEVVVRALGDRATPLDHDQRTVRIHVLRARARRHGARPQEPSRLFSGHAQRASRTRGGRGQDQGR